MAGGGNTARVETMTPGENVWAELEALQQIDRNWRSDETVAESISEQQR